MKRVAIVGAGMIAHRHVAKWRDAGAEVSAVADVNPEVLAPFVQRYGIPSAYSDYRELLEQESTVEIVDICAPPWLHAPIAIAALVAEKHVLCEKPFALSKAEADSMVAAARDAGKVLACRQGETRLARETRTVREVVRSGVLGDIYFLRLITRSLYRPGIEYNPGASWFLERSKAGGGVLYDWGVYDLELLYGVFGPIDVESISAATFSGVGSSDLGTPFDVEEHAVAMLTLRDGKTIFWERAWATHLPKQNRWDFYGTRGGFSFVPHSAMLRVAMDPRLTRFAPEETVDLEVPLLAPPGPDVYEDFLRAVNGKKAPACPGECAGDMLGIIEAVYAATGRG